WWDKMALHRHYRSVNCRLQWRLLINAVKERNPSAALATFLHAPPVPFYLLGHLLEQFFLRTMKRVKGAA
ncbi:MAG TPA: hypothetical protein VFR09_03195, partial [Alphaproteobacteria bacterium]|nr:hypothetical protein [Alphaproteobacteria bacterium]